MHVTGSVDPVRDIEIINTELVLADLEDVRRRRENIGKELKRGDKQAVAENHVLDKIEPHLNAGKPAVTVHLAQEEWEPGAKLLSAHGQAHHLRRQREGEPTSPVPTRTRT